MTSFVSNQLKESSRLRQRYVQLLYTIIEIRRQTDLLATGADNWTFSLKKGVSVMKGCLKARIIARTDNKLKICAHLAC